MATSPRQVAGEMKGSYIIITVTVSMTVIPHPQHTSLLDFFNPWTTTVCRTVNKADSCWEWKQHIHWSVTHPCRPTPPPPTSTAYPTYHIFTWCLSLCKLSHLPVLCVSPTFMCLSKLYIYATAFHLCTKIRTPNLLSKSCLHIIESLTVDKCAWRWLFDH